MCNRTEARHVGSALQSRIRIGDKVVVEHIVGGELPQARVILIDSYGSPVVSQRLVKRGTLKLAAAGVGRRDVVQQEFGRRGPGGLRNLGVRKDALRRIRA